MKGILLHTLLTAGFFFLVSGSAFAQRHPGWPSGPLNASAAPEPAVRTEAPTNRPAIADRQMHEHPFYGSERGHENEWRYTYNGNRWWYWTPLNAWAYWNDGRWVDYSQPYATYYRGAAAPNGWYWSNEQHQWYWFDGSTLRAAQQ